MSVEEFNNKYKDYLEDRYYGLAVDIPEFTEWLDNKFQEFIEYPGFKYRQIKSKFNYGCFYCTGLSQEQVIEVQNKLTSYLNQKT
mgnify:CR=1 FL=1|jgi:hypothetical protein